MKNSGILIFNSLNENPVRSATDFISYVNLNEDYRFELSSRNELNDRTIERYQQTYKGVKIETGGFSLILGGGGDPCRVSALAFIQSNINVSFQNDVEIDDLDNIVEGNIETAELALTKIGATTCQLNLVWKATYVDASGYKIGWIDADSGEILKSRDANDLMFNSSEKKSIGINSFTNSGTPSGINLYDLGPINSMNSGCFDVTAAELFGTSLICSNLSDNQSNLLSQFTSITGCLSNPSAPLGPISFGTINAGIGCGGCNSSPAAIFGSNTTTANFTFPSCSDAHDFEIIGHELGHSYLNTFFPSTTSNLHAGLHEYFADMFALYAASLGCGDFDWIIGDDSNFPESQIRNFDLGEEEGCAHNYTLEDGSFQRHEYGNPLRKLSFLLATGVDDDGASIFTFTQVMTMMTNALAVFPTNGTMETLLNLVLGDVDENFGFCSPQSFLLRQSLAEVCLGSIFNGCQVNIGGSSTTMSSNGSPLMVCEESGKFWLSVPNASTDVNYFWSGLDLQWDIPGQSNNIKGRSITVNFHDYLYYPQVFNVCVRAPSLQSEKVCMKVTIEDCDNDDSTCEEHFDIEDNFNTDGDINIQSRSINRELSNQEPFFAKIHDVSGRILFDGYYSDLNQTRMNDLSGRLIFISYFNEDKVFISAEKYFGTN